MIIIHEGVPGSGKSYDAVRKIVDALKAGRTVYSNIDGLDKDSCREYLSGFLGVTRDILDNRLIHLTADQIRQFWVFCPPGSFVVIDEAQLYFNSRDFAKDHNRQFGDWASTHRHHGYDLLLITQRSARIDTSVRSLCEFKYRYRKLNVFGGLFKKGYLVYTFAGDDEKYLRLEKKAYDVTIFPAYNSYVGDSTEKKVVKNPNILNHPIFYALGICVALMLYYIPQSQILSGDLTTIATGKAHVEDKPSIPASAPGSPGQRGGAGFSPGAPVSTPEDLAVKQELSKWVTIPFSAYIKVQRTGKEYVMIGRRRIVNFSAVHPYEGTVTLLRELLPTEQM